MPCGMQNWNLMPTAISIPIDGLLYLFSLMHKRQLPIITPGMQ